MVDSYDNWNSGVTQEITTALSVVDDTLVFGTQSGDVVRVNPQTGEHLWSHTVLSEPINGVIAGQNAIFVTGKFNSIGGVHIENSIEARIELQELLDLFSTANDYGMTGTTGASEISEAAMAINNGNYDAALQTARAGKDALGEKVSDIESIQETITSTRQDAIRLENETPANTTEIRNTLEKATTALRDQNTQHASTLTERARSELNHLEAGHQNATSEMAKLADSISAARNQSVPVYNSSKSLNSSQSAFKNGDFERAASIANTSRDDIQTRIQTVETYRSHKRRAEELFEKIGDNVGSVPEEQERYNKATSSFESEEFETAAEQMSTTVANLEATLELINLYQEHKKEFETLAEEATTEDIILSEAEDTYQTAVTSFEAADYATATEQMERAADNALNTIATARQARETIAAAKNFSPIQPFVSKVAKQFGSDQYLSAAKTAADAGAYERASTKASKARRAQRSARAVINGGIGSSAVCIYGIHRYNGLNKVADYVVSREE